MIDKLTIYQGRYNKTLLGSYYETKPRTPQDWGAPFDYEILDPHYRQQKTLESNLAVNDYRRLAIKTNDDLSWKISGFVALQDGFFYQIESIGEDIGRVSMQARRNLKYVNNLEYVIRLVQVDNPRQLK